MPETARLFANREPIDCQPIPQVPTALGGYELDTRLAASLVQKIGHVTGNLLRRDELPRWAADRLSELVARFWQYLHDGKWFHITTTVSRVGDEGPRVLHLIPTDALIQLERSFLDLERELQEDES